MQEIQEVQERPAGGRRVRISGDRQGANRRAAVAVSGGAAERPMEPKGFAPPFASLRKNLAEYHWGALAGDAGDTGAPGRRAAGGVGYKKAKLPSF